MPVEMACRIALAVFAEAVLNQGKGTLQQQMKAAMWMTKLLERQGDYYAEADVEERSATSPTGVVG